MASLQSTGTNEISTLICFFFVVRPTNRMSILVENSEKGNDQSLQFYEGSAVPYQGRTKDVVNT